MQVQTGQGKQKRYETTANTAYASFEHDVTRPVEHVLDDREEVCSGPAPAYTLLCDEC
jgi:hypothetical protein